MSDAPGEQRDTIDAGRRLVRGGAEGGHSLGQRLADYFERLTWRTPIHDMRLKGRYPLRLLVVPIDPVAGDRERGEALLDGWLIWRGEVRALAETTFAGVAGSRGFDDHLQGFGWLRDLAAAPDRARATKLAEQLTAQWLAAHGERVADAGWRPDLWGRRLLMWSAHAPLLLASTDLVFRSRVLNAIARGARHLDRSADRAAAGLARVASWCGVVAAGLVIPGGDPRRAFGEAGLARALGVSVSGDGGLVSRSPVDQLDAVVLLAMLRAVYEARRVDWPDALAQPLGRMIPALLGTTLGDGGLGSWQGAMPLGAAEVRAAVTASGAPGRALRQAREWGYQRMAAGKAVLAMDVAPPPLAPVAGGGCASTLAFELSDAAERIVVNCGGALSAAARGAAFARALRTTAAHSTLTIADSNSTAIHPDGSLGRGVGEVELSRQESDAGSRIDASHDGYARRHGFVHNRALVLTADGRELRGEDALMPRGRRVGRRATPFAIRFHLGPGVTATATADGMGAVLRTPAGMLWQFRTRADALTLDDSIWIDADGQTVTTQQIVIAGSAEPGGASVGWALKRAR